VQNLTVNPCTINPVFASLFWSTENKIPHELLPVRSFCATGLDTRLQIFSASHCVFRVPLVVSWDRTLGTVAGKITLGSIGYYLLGLAVAVVVIVVTGPVMLSVLSQPTALLTPLRARHRHEASLDFT